MYPAGRELELEAWDRGDIAIRNGDEGGDDATQDDGTVNMICSMPSASGCEFDKSSLGTRCPQ